MVVKEEEGERKETVAKTLHVVLVDPMGSGGRSPNLTIVAFPNAANVLPTEHTYHCATFDEKVARIMCIVITMMMNFPSTDIEVRVDVTVCAPTADRIVGIIRNARLANVTVRHTMRAVYDEVDFEDD